jgi:hypothetical protein
VGVDVDEEAADQESLFSRFHCGAFSDSEDLLEWGGTRRAAMERFHIQKYMGAGRQSTINKKDLK